MKLRVYFDKVLAGTLERNTSGTEESYTFTYLPEYLAKDTARPVSVNLPLQQEPFYSQSLFPFFDNLLAEGWLLDLQSKTHKIDKNDRFAMISACGLECIGAVSLRGEADDTMS